MQPEQDTIRDLLENAHTIAVVGAKDAPSQPVDGVGRYLIEAGYTVIPVHPVRKNVWGLTTYPSLNDVPHPVDIVNIFRAPQYCPGHAHEVLALAHKPAAFWMQLGINSTEAASLMHQAGILVVQNKCLKVEHFHLFPIV